MLSTPERNTNYFNSNSEWHYIVKHLLSGHPGLPPPHLAASNQSPEIIVYTKLQMKPLSIGHLYLAPFGRDNKGFPLSLPL